MEDSGELGGEGGMERAVNKKWNRCTCGGVFFLPFKTFSYAIRHVELVTYWAWHWVLSWISHKKSTILNPVLSFSHIAWIVSCYVNGNMSQYHRSVEGQYLYVQHSASNATCHCAKVCSRPHSQIWIQAEEDITMITCHNRINQRAEKPQWEAFISCWSLCRPLCQPSCPCLSEVFVPEVLEVINICFPSSMGEEDPADP